jgi:hypothetical protein
MTSQKLFEKYSRWLAETAELFRKSGQTVEFKRTEGTTCIVRLRIESSARLVELTAWSHGTAHGAAIDLADGNVIIERDGMSLNVEPSIQFKDFVEVLKVE